MYGKNGKRDKKGRKFLTLLMVFALSASQLPIQQVQAVQAGRSKTQGTVKQEITDNEAPENRESPAETSNAEAPESETSATEEPKAEVPETEAPATETAETEESETKGSEEKTTETEESGTETSEEKTTETKESGTKESEEETSGTEATETEESETQERPGDAKETETAPKLDYIKGRPLTQEEIEAQKALEPAYMPDIEIVELPEEADFSSGGTAAYSILPEKYDPREQADSCLPAIRNQNPWGTCWAFAFLGAMEMDMVRKGIETADNADLSEKQLAYFTYHTGYDALNNAEGDTIESNPADYYLKKGGNDYKAAVRLMNWNGAALESEYPYHDASGETMLDCEDAQRLAVYLKNAYFYPTKANDTDTIQGVKNMVYQYGAVSWSYCHDRNYYNEQTGAYFYHRDSASTNHAIIVVGWDDSYSKANFRKEPENDGAWIVRNSYGPGYGDGGYIYISYEDRSLGAGNAACAVETEEKGSYDNNYFYGNTLSIGNSGKHTKVAQIYQIKPQGNAAKAEKVTAVSFMTASANLQYRIELYKDPDTVNGVVENPESGTLLAEATTEGATSYSGMYTVNLGHAVEAGADSFISVVITFLNERAFIYCDKSTDTTGTEPTSGHYCKAENATQPGQSFYSLSGSSWVDYATPNSNDTSRSLRINMLTENVYGAQPAIKTIDIAGRETYAGTARINLQWSGCEGAASYEVYRKVGEGRYERRAAGLSSLAYEDVADNTDSDQYSYKIRALYGPDAYEESPAVSCTIDFRPSGPALTIEDHNSEAQLIWGASAQAAGYELERRTEGETAYTPIYSTQSASALNYTDKTDPDKWGTYDYRIRAFFGSGSSREYSRWTEAGLKKDLHIKQTAYDTVKLQWQEVNGARGYKICVSANGNTASFHTQETQIPNLEISGYPMGDDLTYSVTAYDTFGNGTCSGTAIYETTKVIFHTVPDKPVIQSAAYTEENGITISWQHNAGSATPFAAYSGATGMEVYRSEMPSDPGKKIAEIDLSSSTDLSSYTERIGTSGLERAKTYYYRLAATVTSSDGKKRTSGLSDAVRADTAPAPVTISSLTEKRTSDKKPFITITWAPAENAGKYQLYRQTGAESGGYTLLAGSLADCTYEDTDVLPDTAYSYKVLVETNGHTSILDSSPQGRIVTKPVLAKLETSLDSENEGLFLIHGDSTAFTVTPTPAHYPYKNELAWQAQDIYGTEYGISAQEGSITVFDHGKKEALKIILPQNGGDTYRLEACEEGSARQIQLHAYIDDIPAKTANIIIADNGLWIDDIPAAGYTGKAVTPQIKVYDKTKLLTQGKDYTVAYKNNSRAWQGTLQADPAKQPQAIVAGKGNYTGKATAGFEIVPVDIRDETAVTADDLACSYKAGKVQKPLPQLIWNGKKLANSKDFTVSYPDKAGGAYCSRGKYDIVVKGIGNFTGERKIKLTITSLGLISSAKAAAIKKQAYTGAAIEPKLTVKSGKKTLVEGIDYKATYSSNTMPGQAAVLITGINGYSGTKRVTFTIIGTDIRKAMVSGLEKTLPFSAEGQGSRQRNCKLERTLKHADGTKTTILLREGEDYTTEYRNAGKAGTATILFIGKNGYTGTLKKTYKITPYDIQADPGNVIQISVGSVVPYEKGGSRPKPRVSFGSRQLKEGTDYTVSYINNDAIHQEGGSRNAALAIRGKGSFKGTVQIPFRIERQNIAARGIQLTAKDKTFQNKKGAHKTTLTIKDINGRILSAGKDYEKAFCYTYAADTVLADAAYRNAGEEVRQDDVIPPGTTLHVTVRGKGNYYGEITGSFHIAKCDISKANIKVNAKLYTGEAVELDKNDIRVTYGGKELAQGIDYELGSYADNTEKGKASVSVSGIGDYGGTRKVRFPITSRALVWWRR